MNGFTAIILGVALITSCAVYGGDPEGARSPSSAPLPFDEASTLCDEIADLATHKRLKALPSDRPINSPTPMAKAEYKLRLVPGQKPTRFISIFYDGQRGDLQSRHL